MTHPFHPLAGRDFEFVARRQNWGEDRVHLHDENGQVFSLLAGWTDASPAVLAAIQGDRHWVGGVVAGERCFYGGSGCG